MSEYKLYKQMKYYVAKNEQQLKDALMSNNYALTCKKDGASYIFAKDLDGSVHAYGDRISKKTGLPIDKIECLPHMADFMKEHFPNGSQLVAEVLCYHDWTTGTDNEFSRSSYVNSIMLCSGPKAALRQEQTQPCEIYVFDILFWDNESYFDRDFAERYEKMRNLEFEVFPYTHWLSFAETVFENKDEAIADWLASGEEGGVLKLLHSNNKVSAHYAVTDMNSTAKRPAHTTYKIKQVDTIDVVITGVEYPTKEYTGTDPEHAQYRDEDGNPINRLYALGMINAYKIGLYKDGELITIGTIASGLNDEERLHAANSPEYHIGAVIEVECMSIDKVNHTLRHGRLMRYRPDKEPESCLWNEVFE